MRERNKKETRNKKDRSGRHFHWNIMARKNFSKRQTMLIGICLSSSAFVLYISLHQFGSLQKTASELYRSINGPLQVRAGKPTISNNIIHYNVAAPTDVVAAQANAGPASGIDASKDPALYTTSELSAMLKARLELPVNYSRTDFSKPCNFAELNYKGCTDTKCKNLENYTPEERIKFMTESPEMKLSDEQRKTILTLANGIPENDVIIASACSSNHFTEMQAMFKSLHDVAFPILHNFTVVLFDIGLSERERKLTEKHCRCTVIKFPSHLFPPHLRENFCYGWKPLIIRAAITKARKVLIWQDASIRWKARLPLIIERTAEFGQQVLRYDGMARVTAHTLKETFDYMHQDVCQYYPYPELDCSVSLHKNDPLVIRGILEPWARCALEKQCICPKPPGSVLGCGRRQNHHRCHRFDQSVLTILTAKLYAENIHKISMPEFIIGYGGLVATRRGDVKSNYFT